MFTLADTQQTLYMRQKLTKKTWQMTQCSTQYVATKDRYTQIRKYNPPGIELPSKICLLFHFGKQRWDESAAGAYDFASRHINSEDSNYMFSRKQLIQHARFAILLRLKSDTQTMNTIYLFLLKPNANLCGLKAFGRKGRKFNSIKFT